MKINLFKKFAKLLSFYLILLGSNGFYSEQLFAASSSSIEPIAKAPTLEESVKAKFQLIIQQINNELRKNQSIYSQSEEKLAEYVDRALLPIWSSKRTLAGLLGNKTWKMLNIGQQNQLVSGFNNTIQRYVQEGFSKYNGQRIEYQGIRLSSNQKKGYLTVKVIPEILPEFNIDFKIVFINDDWYLYDAGTQGISYIALKKESFRRQYEENGIVGLLSELNDKNAGYLPSRYSK